MRRPGDVDLSKLAEMRARHAAAETAFKERHPEVEFMAPGRTPEGHCLWIVSAWKYGNPPGSFTLRTRRIEIPEGLDLWSQDAFALISARLNE